ncbi:MAG: hypothetical protein AMXMBFR82_47810 [Candidatus Hydrogenedentota bacterium]
MRRKLVCLSMVLALTAVGGAQEPFATVAEMAMAVECPAGAPRYSDVSMRLFRKYEDGRELAAAEAFHITRADWSYIRDKAYIEAVQARGWTFQGSTNAVTYKPEFALKDENGEPVLDHFKKPGRFWSDCNNAVFRDAYVEELREWVALGVDSIQRDEPTAIRHWSIPDAVDFFEDVHGRLKEAVGRDIPMSVNLAWNKSVFGGDGEPLTKLFEFGMAELGSRHVEPQFFVDAANEAAQRQSFIVYTSYQKMDVSTYRRAIAGCYANGLLFIVPWDQYAGTTEPRVFSAPDDLADLYGFVRGNAAYLDGYEAATATGHSLGASEALSIEGDDGVTAWVRARPGEAGAPVVIHLVDWNESGGFQVRLRNDAFFPGKDLEVELRAATPYDPITHASAEKAQDFSSLVAIQALDVESEGGLSRVSVPELSPWGMLVVRPVD